MKKYINLKTSLVLGLTFSMGLTGCGGGSPMDTPTEAADEKEEGNTDSSSGTTITLWSTNTGSDGDVIRRMIDEYNESNEWGDKVEIDIMSGENVTEKLPSAIATGTGPDLVNLSDSQLPTYAMNDQLEPMDDFFEVTGMDESDFEESVLKGLQYEGVQMMMPLHWYTSFLYWNKDLFRSAGLDPEKYPETWEEAAEMAKQITDSTKNVYGLGLVKGGGIAYMNAMFMANGGNVVDENHSCVLDSESNLKTLQYIQEAVVNDKISPAGLTGADMDNLMLAGQVAMYCNGPWLVNGLRESGIDFGVAPMPKGTEKAVGIQEVQGFAMPKGISEEHKTAAYHFLQFWNSTENQKEWDLTNGFPPHLKSVAQDAEIQEDPIVSVFSTMSDFAVQFAPGLACVGQMNDDAIWPMIENIQNGNDCQTELTNAANKVSEILAAQ